MMLTEGNKSIIDVKINAARDPPGAKLKDFWRTFTPALLWPEFGISKTHMCNNGTSRWLFTSV